MKWGCAPDGDQTSRLAYEAYLLLFFGAIDGELDAAEKSTIRSLLDERAASLGGVVDVALQEAAAYFDSLCDNASRADSLAMVCRILGEVLSRAELLELHEHCVDVACVDGHIHDREVKLLEVVKETWRV